MPGGIALVFPPLWYYAQVPADLLYTGSQLTPRPRCFDLSSGLMAALLGQRPGWQALRDEATYRDERAYGAASADLFAACAELSRSYAVELSPYRLRFPGIDEGHIPSALAVGLDDARNPALRYLREQAVPAILRDDPRLIGVVLGHSDQIVQVPVLGRLLRRAGYRGHLTLYGSHEDVVTPEDLADDLSLPDHLLYEDYDSVILGEAEAALQALWQAITEGAAPRGVIAARPGGEGLLELKPVDAALLDPAIYPFPAPVIDLRLSRSCPYGRCTFCAITTHQAGYRARPTDAVLADMERLHAAQGSRLFFFRDDLLTPRQLQDLGDLTPRLAFAPRFAARARFEPGLTREVLAAAHAGGLRELWLGLESAAPRVRGLMQKGVGQSVVERILLDADEVGVRVRALCLIGYPGETLAEAQGTLAFLERHMFRLAHAALTPFQLMRSAPLGRDPARHGLRVAADPAPPRERLRYALTAQGPGLLPTEQVRALIAQGAARLHGWFGAAAEGPTLMHALWRAMVS